MGKTFPFMLLQFKLSLFPVFKKHFFHFLFLSMLYNNLGILVKNLYLFPSIVNGFSFCDPSSGLLLSRRTK